MKFRADSTTSERQLILAMAGSGRELPLSKLVSWRKDGLLPPLASTGASSGRAYYWREPDIQAQAETAYDALRRHGRVDMAIITLWLHGFEVPLARLRRAWLYRGKLARPPNVRTSKPAASPDACGSGMAGLLLQALVCMSGAVEGFDADRALMPVLERALARLGQGSASDRSALALWRLVAILAATLEGGNLVREATDQQMLEARRTLRAAMPFLAGCCQDERPADVVDALGPRAFVMILALLRSGQDAVLQTISARMDTSAARRAPRAAAGLHAQA